MFAFEICRLERITGDKCKQADRNGARFTRKEFANTHVHGRESFVREIEDRERGRALFAQAE